MPEAPAAIAAAEPAAPSAPEAAAASEPAASEAPVRAPSAPETEIAAVNTPTGEKSKPADKAQPTENGGVSIMAEADTDTSDAAKADGAGGGTGKYAVEVSPDEIAAEPMAPAKPVLEPPTVTTAAKAPEATPDAVAAAEPTAAEPPAAKPAEPVAATETPKKVAPAPETRTAAVDSAGKTEPPAAKKAEPVKPVEAKKEPPPPPKIEPAVAVTAVEADTAGGLFIAGTAKTPETVRVYLDDAVLGETRPTEGGTWLLELHRELPPGRYSVRADQVDKSGTVIVRAEVPFDREIEVATLKPVAEMGGPGGAAAKAEMPELQTVIIRRTDNLWRISRRMYGKGVRWSTLYAANKDQIRNPRWIFPGQVFTIPAGDENWKE
jgi:hypothetical protein